MTTKPKAQQFTHCVFCKKSAPDPFGNKGSRYKPEHVWAKCYACPKCLDLYPTDDAAMAGIRPLVVAKEKKRMARAAAALQAEAAASTPALPPSAS